MSHRNYTSNFRINRYASTKPILHIDAPYIVMFLTQSFYGISRSVLEIVRVFLLTVPIRA